ncbi:MAG: hypothetical protein IPK77_05035 [Cellvibrio sp.]|nr:hypothetical protein [Cellvibrio sp.]
MTDFEHLRIEREPLENDRRTRRTNIPRHPRGDLGGHGQKLTNDLTQAFRFAQQQQTSRPGNFVLKLRYVGHLDISHLHRCLCPIISDTD